MFALWRIELLGGLRLVGAGETIYRFRSRIVASLLAYLAYYLETPHPRDALVELLWPECDRDTGRLRFRVALNSLRRQLEPHGVPAGSVLIADRATVRLNGERVATDVGEFRAALRAATGADPAARLRGLRDAVERYHGGLLPHLCEDWALAEQRRLEKQFFQAVDELVAHLEALGDLSEAMRYAGKAAAVDPLREEARRTLMRLQAAAGRPGEALREYRDLERGLARKVGVSPSPATRALLCRIAETAGPASSSEPPGAYPAKQALIAIQPASQKPAGARQEFPPPRAERALHPHLPTPLTRSFGRDVELRTLTTLLSSDGSRLVTLTGTGGAGKTRLALEAALKLKESFQGCVWFVPLADLRDGRLLIDAVRDALGLPRSPARTSLDQVVEALESHRGLLVLDNFEQLLSDESASETERLTCQGTARQTVRRLLERLPGLTCLVTSRQWLELSGEQVFPVAPLGLPGETDLPASLLSAPSVQLFVDRARAVRPDFQVTSRNAPAVGELCRRLEGLPLALELGASRISIATPARMLERLTERLDFLASRRPEAGERHHSLRSVCDWSYRLLSPDLQQLFARLSVFRGGWTLGAAEKIGGGLSEGATAERLTVMDALEQLRAASLVLAEDSGDELRFRMLETLREYAWERLSPGEAVSVRQRHADYFTRMAEAACGAAGGSQEQRRWVQTLEPERENLRAALEWSLQPGGQREQGLRLAGMLAWFWEQRAYGAEGRRWLATLLEPAGPPGPGRALALRGLGLLAWQQGRDDDAAAAYGECLTISRALRDTAGTASALSGLGTVALSRRDFGAARECFREALALRRASGNRVGEASSLMQLGHLARRTGRLEEARELYQASLQIECELGARIGEAGCLHSLGDLAYTENDLGGAAACYHCSLAIYREVDYQGQVAAVVLNLAHLAWDRGELKEAQACLDEATRLYRELGNRRKLCRCFLISAGVAWASGNARAATDLFEEAAAYARQAGLTGDLGTAAVSLAAMARHRGDSNEARLRWQEGRVHCATEGDTGIARALEALALLLRPTEVEDAAELVRLCSAAASLRTSVGAPPTPESQARLDRHLDGSRQLLTGNQFRAAWEVGRRTPVDELVAAALTDRCAAVR